MTEPTRPKTSSPYDVNSQPVPLSDCAACQKITAKREAARAEFDYSAVSDGTVMLRAHLRTAHDQ
ncbi:hypothetical protein [Streptomyces capitiformicae]|nr:hypothetical protein [Streptomyces capitiformicae]